MRALRGPKRRSSAGFLRLLSAPLLLLVLFLLGACGEDTGRGGGEEASAVRAQTRRFAEALMQNDSELLAEVASFLHLVMYGLMCVTLLVLRRRDPQWYDPSFEVPGYPVVPAAGALASFALVAFMQPASIAVGVVVMAAAYAWYRYYAGGVVLEGAI